MEGGGHKAEKEPWRHDPNSTSYATTVQTQAETRTHTNTQKHSSNMWDLVRLEIEAKSRAGRDYPLSPIFGYCQFYVFVVVANLSQRGLNFPWDVRRERESGRARWGEWVWRRKGVVTLQMWMTRGGEFCKSRGDMRGRWVWQMESKCKNDDVRGE